MKQLYRGRGRETGAFLSAFPVFLSILGALDCSAETNDPFSDASARKSLSLEQLMGFDVATIKQRPSEQTPGHDGRANRLHAVVCGVFWHVHDTMMEDIDRVELSIVGQNLVPARHMEFASGTTVPQAIPRSVDGRITWHF